MKLLLGDCIDEIKKLEDNSIDFVLTDPPYNISRDNNFNTMGRSSIDFGEWDKDADLLSWIDEIHPKLKKNSGMVIFNGWQNLGPIATHCEKVGFKIKDFIRMEKTNPMPRNRDRRYVTDCEYAIWVTKKGSKWVFNRQEDTYDRPKYITPVVGGKEKVNHPTQKPLSVLEEMLIRHTNEGDIVIDPFMGSGSTGVACIRTNRKFIGIEIDETYFELSQRRVTEELENK